MRLDETFRLQEADYSTRIDKAIGLMFQSPVVQDMSPDELKLLAVAILDQAGVDAKMQDKIKSALGVTGKTAR